MSLKYKIQDMQYEFPYHYIPYMDTSNSVCRIRALSWGHEYLSQLSYVKDKVIEFKPNSVLDVGCGDGRFLGLLKNEVKTIKGIDLSERAISFAKVFNPDIDFECIDIKNINSKYDIVLAIEVLEHVPDNETTAFIKEIFSKTVNGGIVIITVPTEVVPLNKKHYRHYNIEKLEAAIQLAGISKSTIAVEYLCKHNLFFYLLRGIFHNKIWDIQVKPLNKFITMFYRRFILCADSKNGRNLLLILRKGS